MTRIKYKHKYKKRHNVEFDFEVERKIVYRTAIYTSLRAAISAAGKLKGFWDKVQRSGQVVMASRKDEHYDTSKV